MKISVEKDIAALRTSAAAMVDALAAAYRALYATPGKDAVYLAKRDEAAAYIAAGEPDDLTDYPYLRAEVGITVVNASDLAELWRSSNATLAGEIDPRIERATFTAKAAIAAAADPATLDEIIADLTFD
jgi:hypothetical protein